MAIEGAAPTRDPARTHYWLSRGECPECKSWDGAGDWNGHVELKSGLCPKCGGEFNV